MPSTSVQRHGCLLSALIVLGVAFAAALITSKLYWGYFFTQPGLNARVAAASHYAGLTSFQSLPREGGPAAELVLAPSRDFPTQKLLRLAEQDPYNWGYVGVLQHLERRGVLAALPPLDSARLAEALPALTASGLLERPEPAYAKRQYLTGVALEAKERDGTRLLYVAAHGAEVANDHYPHYQFLFEATRDGWKLADHTRSFIEISGVEFAQWPVLFVLYTLPCLALWSLLLLLVRLGRRWAAPRIPPSTRAGLDAP